MHRRLTVLLAAVLAAPSALSAQDSAPRTSLAFEVDVTKPESGKIGVRMQVRHVNSGSIKVSIPAWAPGAYRIVKYAKAVRNVQARDKEGTTLKVEPVDDQTWKVETDGSSKVTVSYELIVERSRMDREHCFLTGPETYFYLVGDKGTPCSVRFRLPEGWEVGTGLDRDGEVYKAVDYDTFIDCPTELGKFELLEFVADQTTYQLVIHSVGPVKGDVLVDMCRKIVKDQNRIFGDLPFDRYVFIFHFNNRMGGRGLEHLNSTDITMSYPAIKIQPLLSASVTSHEYFHLWNVKRIRPLGLGPFDYTKPVRTRALWFCEGVTSYFGDRTLCRTGIWSENMYLRHLAGEVMSLQNNPDRKVTSMEKASWTVWTRRDYPRVDYYNKGELLGLLIDVKTRHKTQGKKTLDDVMRYLYRTYVLEPSEKGKGPIGLGFPEDGLLNALNHVTGLEWDGFYDRHIRGVAELPFRKVLQPAGLKMNLVVNRYSGFGIRMRGNTVLYVPTGSSAAKAGFRRGDRIEEIDGEKVTRETASNRIRRLKAGADAKVKVARGKGEAELSVPILQLERTNCSIRRASELTDAQKRLLDSWLHGRREF